MKIIRIFLLMILVMAAGCIIYPRDRDYAEPYPESRTTYPGTYESAYGRLDTSFFYDYLSAYGTWIRYSPYGYVWIPRRVSYGWRPFIRGQWAWTDYGWTWVSGETWGWAVYHYGRWGWNRRLGWFWVPDSVWAPAWVFWRWDDIYIGWSPVPPGYDFRPGYGFGRNKFDIPNDHWIFVRGRYFMHDSIDRWILPWERNLTIINMTVFNSNMRYVDNRIFNEGPSVNHVRNLTNSPVSRQSLKENAEPGEARLRGNEVLIYKPSLAENRSARPRDFVEEEDFGKEAVRSEGRIIRKYEGTSEAEIGKIQDKERKLLEETQQLEIKEVSRRLESDIARAGSQEERRKITENMNSRIAELKKVHEKEKAALIKRQKEEKGEKAEKKEPEKKSGIIRKKSG